MDYRLRGGALALDLGLTGLAGRGKAVVTPTTGIIAANRGSLPTKLTTGGATPFTTRVSHWSHPGGDISNLQFVDVGWYYALAGSPGNAGWTLKRYLEYPSGTFTQVTWGGSGSVTIANLGQAISDIVAITIPANTKFWERTVITAYASTGWPVYDQPAGSVSLGLDDGNSASDAGNSGTINPSSSTPRTCSAAIIGTVNKSDARSCLVCGDSISVGTGDISSTGSKGGSGYIQRLVNNMPFVTMGAGGQQANNVASMIGSASLQAFISAIGFSDFICELGINDLSLGSRTEAQLLASYSTIFGAIQTLKPNARRYQTTLTPRTSSTDAWATIVNQTAKTDGTMSLLNTINADIRAPQSYINGLVLDAADTAMTARDSDIWAGPFPPTTDGTHPSSAKAIAMAAALTPLVA